MKKIVLISCAASKSDKKSKAKDLYKGALFTKSLAYGQQLNPDKIYILSALHHLIELEKEIDPYDVTLKYISPKERLKKPHLKVLTKKEIKEWGEKVIADLKKVADIENDVFIVLAGEDYIKPIQSKLNNIEKPFVIDGKKLRQGERLQFLNNRLNDNAGL